MDLDLDKPYRIGEVAFASLLRDVASLGPGQIVEFGAGASSIRLARALPDTRVLSIEHDMDFYGNVKARVDSESEGLANLGVDLRPLEWQRVGPCTYRSYASGDFPSVIDAVIVDGPPYWALRGREACLHQVAGLIRVGGRIYLDDLERNDESLILNNWLRAYRGLKHIHTLEVGHRIAVLEVAQPLRRRLNTVNIADNWVALAKECRSAWRRRRRGV